jgi:probable phosphomutase (TIGR03848 family)
MTRLLLIRHAHSVANDRGVLAGRSGGVVLTERGKKEADELATRLQGISVSAIHISPLERCHLTMAPFLKTAKGAKAPRVIVSDDLLEVDYGSWTGKKLSSLYRQKLWKTVQNRPSAMYFPEGEGLAAVQVRAMRALHTAAAMPGNQVLVSHGDVIKSIVAGILGTHLDNFQKIIIDPASVTALDFDGTDFRILTLNSTSTPVANLLPVKKKSIGKALIGGGPGSSKSK